MILHTYINIKYSHGLLFIDIIFSIYLVMDIISQKDKNINNNQNQFRRFHQNSIILNVYYYYSVNITMN